MYRLQIITGSIRPNRLLDSVTPWVVRHARAHGAFDVEVLDLREWALPMFAEHAGSIGDPTDPTYSDPVVKRWNTTIAAGDGYLFVTPEYNHSVPAVLKNALETVFASFAFRNKPAGFVGYSTSVAGGARAIEHLAQIAIDHEMVPPCCSVRRGARSATTASRPTRPAGRASRSCSTTSPGGSRHWPARGRRASCRRPASGWPRRRRRAVERVTA